VKNGIVLEDYGKSFMLSQRNDRMYLWLLVKVKDKRGTREMKQDLDDLYEGPRLERRLKKKKYNLILNGLIGIVVILVLYFGSQLFFSNDDNASATKDKTHTYVNDSKVSHESVKHDQKKVDEDTSNMQANENSNNNTKDDDKNVVVKEGSPDSNLLNTIVNPSWQPVGTVQSEPHVSVYKENSVDWDEMMKAVSYATGLADSSYTIWWIGRNGENQSTITLENNEDHKLSRVYIQWVKDEGWKPLRIEELKENDTPAFKGH
jgi:hypothetical protein